MTEPLPTSPSLHPVEPEPIVARIVEGQADELRLLPPDCPSSDQFRQRFEKSDAVEPAPVPPPARYQFSLVDLMIVTAGVGLGLAGGTWMPADYFAGIMGLLILGGLILVHFYPLESHGAKLAWGTFILAYFVALLAAIFRRETG